MNDHLTQEQISESVAGIGTNGTHLRECATCRAEAARLSDTLALFRQSVRFWSADQEAIPMVQRATERHWGWTAAVATCLIAGLMLWHGNHAQPALSRQTMSDADLLVRVDRELSEAVPPSMAPIALNEVEK